MTATTSFKISYAGIRRIMIFIDGGHLINLRDLFKNTKIETNFSILIKSLKKFGSGRFLFADLIRVYYYHGISTQALQDPKGLSASEQRQQFLNTLRNTDYVQLREGILKSVDGKLKQIGVDTMVAIDMLSKAYKNQFDVAIVLSGDDDFVDIVTAVKDSGKRVFGAFIEGHASEELKFKFDRRLILTREYLIRNNIVTTC